MRTRILMLTASIACTLSFAPLPANACDICDGNVETTASASGHAPIGVMGDHMHHKGEWMLGYRFMHMDMAGNRSGTKSLSPETIVTTEANRFFGTPGQPATLRVVPKDMSMDMHMLGLMYAPIESVTVTIMAQYIGKDMTAITYAGGAGTTVLGTFDTKSTGWGDTKVNGALRLYDDAANHLHASIGISLPTGAIDKTATVLTPSGTTPRMKLAYGMQLGTGTYDLLPGLTYTGHKGPWGWGAQYSAQIPLEDSNGSGYRWANKHNVTAWGSYEWAQWISTSARLSGTSQGKIKGIDPQIVAPMQAADPENYGGQELNLGLGLNLIGTRGVLTDHRFAIEATAALYRDLNGPQLEKDWTINIGWQHAF